MRLNERMRKLFTIVLTLCIVVSMLLASALITFAADAVSYIEYSWDGSALSSQTKTVTNYTVCTGSETSLDAGWYVVSGSVTVSGSLRVDYNATVNMILMDGAVLTTESGIQVPSDSTINIYAQSNGSNMGKIVVPSNSSYVSGIGARENALCGNINIHGGDLSLYSGGNYTSGLGVYLNSTENNCVINIYSGKLRCEPKTGYKGYGINAGDGTLNIYGGDITAIGANGKAISGANVNLYGGNVTAEQRSNSGSLLGGTFTIKGGNLSTPAPDTATDGESTVSYLEITLSGAFSGEKIVALYDANGDPIAYGTNDMTTMDTDKLYLHLAAASNLTYVDTSRGLYQVLSDGSAEFVHTHSYTGTPSYTPGAKQHTVTVPCVGCLVDAVKTSQENHTFSGNGFCTLCDAYQPAVLNADNVYEIGNAGQLYWFADNVNNDNENFAEANAILTADIVVNEKVLDNGALVSDTSALRAWTPIGTSDSSYEATFDGQGHTISGLFYSNPSGDNVGLFGELGGIVRNLNIRDLYINGRNSVAGIAGGTWIGTVEMCTVQGTITGNEYVGGIIGNGNYGAITNCRIDAAVSGKRNVGAIGGYLNSLKLTNSYSYTSQGVVGKAGGSFSASNCYYLSDTETDSFDGTTAKTAAQFASGEVAYLLQKDQQAQVWGQNIDNGGENEGYPVFSEAKVYYGYASCAVGTVKIYTNNSDTTPEKTEHIPNENGYTVNDDGTTHSYTCATCGMVITEDHSGGTATCTIQAVCDDCGTSYGDLDADNHSGGTATCTTQAVCDACGKSYGDLDADNHSGAPGAAVPTEDGAQHVKEWSCCGLVFIENHTGGTATCNTQAVCDDCGTSYGDKDTTNHDESIAYDDYGFCPNGCYEPAQLNADNVYEIGNAGQLYWFAEKVNNDHENFDSADAVLTDDLVVNEKVLENGALVSDPSALRVWTPFGSDRYLYSGTFDGNGKTVSGLYYNVPDGGKAAGLVGFLGFEGVVKNVRITDSFFHSDYNVGGVAGANFGQITGCYVVGQVIVRGSMNTGGVVGGSIGQVTGCYTDGQVTVSGNTRVGGVVGVNERGTIENCFNTASVSGDTSIGGVVGYSDSTSVANCYNWGTVTGSSYVGGVAGANGDILTGCYNIGTVSGSSNIGGLIGINDGTVTNSYYLSGCAKDGSDVTQYGIGSADQGATTEDAEGSTTGKTADQFASGEVAYLLNGSTSEGDLIWKQTIGTDASPNFTGETVYRGYLTCADGVEIGYSNDPAVPTTKPPHTYSDRGICTVCGGYEPADLVENVYEIGNPGQLLWFAMHVNENRDAWSAAARLVADIDMTGLPWIPIGDPGYDSSIEYKGDFDGNYHTVSGIDYTVTGDSGKVCAGFFGQIYRGNTKNSIRNLTVKGSFRAVYTGTGDHTAFCGGIVASMLSAYPDAVAIENCAFTGSLSAESSYQTVIGGIVGSALYGKVHNCYASAAISAEGTGTNVQGALVGMNADTENDGLASTIFENCYYDSTVCPLTACGDCEVPSISGKTTEQFASGEVAYLLNGATSEGDLVWKQTIGTDVYPVFAGDTVYYGYISCAVNAKMVHTNDPAASDTKPDHTPNTEGLCTACGYQYAASVTLDGETNYYTLTDAMAATNGGSGAVLKLLKDITLEDTAPSNLVEFRTTCTLDLNGMTLNQRILVNDAILTIVDTALEKGTVVNADGSALEYWSGRIIIDPSVDCTGEAQGHEAWIIMRETSEEVGIGTTGNEDLVIPEGCVVLDSSMKQEQTILGKLSIIHRHADANTDHICDNGCRIPRGDHADADSDHACDYGCAIPIGDHEAAEGTHDCGYCGKPASECTDKDFDGDHLCDVCGNDLWKFEDVTRLAGSHRWETALKVADEMKANLDIEKFDAIIIASGNDFADALAGSYLSTVKNAPILLGWGKGGKFEYLDTDNIEYIKDNLAEGGTVYILGGKNAVPELYENELKGYNVKRLGGANRFETNLLILAEAGVADGSEILVCTSTNFADSLSASATAKPILLVFNEYGKLYGKQPEFLAGLKNCTFTVIGGESAVSADLAKAIEAYGKVERLAGANRFETSVMVAQKYFKDVDTAVLAYAWNYPDGLCGGSLAYSLKAPLILTMTKYEEQAVAYAKAAGITTGLVLGGDTLISDEAVRSIFAMDAADEIIEK